MCLTFWKWGVLFFTSWLFCLFLQFCNTIWTCLCLDMIVFGPVCLNECLECFLLFRWETILPTKVLTIFCFSISGEETIFVFPVFQYSFAEVFRLLSSAQGWCRETEARETKICWAIKSFLQWERGRGGGLQVSSSRLLANKNAYIQWEKYTRAINILCNSSDWPCSGEGGEDEK